MKDINISHKALGTISMIDVLTINNNNKLILFERDILIGTFFVFWGVFFGFFYPLKLHIIKFYQNP